MRNISIALIAVCILIISISCATSPEKGAKETDLEKGNSVSSEQLQKETETAKKDADNIKANIAMKKEYDKALALYEKAMKESNAGDFDKAAKNFEEAKRIFLDVYKQTEVKMARAEKSIEESKGELQLVEQKVQDAGL
jgi:hypothetical protein